MTELQKILANTSAETADPVKSKQPIPELSKSEKFLRALFSKASARGYTPVQIVAQCMRIDQLERKYSKSYEELRNEYTQLGWEISNKTNKVNELEERIAAIKKQKADMMREYSVDEKRVREYVDSRAELSSMGFQIDDVPKVKTCLISIKNEKFNPEKIIEKLSAIADLEERKNALATEVTLANGDLREKKDLLIQLRQMQQTGLSVDQMERIRSVVSKISSRRGINPDQSFSIFESDVLKNYDLALGLESEIARLEETKNSISREFEERKKELDNAEKNLTNKLNELDSKYQAKKAELQSYSELLASGVEGSRILSWHHLILENGLDFGVVESELNKQGSLKKLEEETSRRISELQEQKRKIEFLVAELNEKKGLVESSISSITDNAIKGLETSRTSMLSSASQMMEEMKQSSSTAKKELNGTLSELNATATGFTSDLRTVFRQAEPEMKNMAEVLKSAERIGKYEAILPILKLKENGKVDETEALVAMWSISNIFIDWLDKSSAPARKEILEPLKRTLAAINQEILTVRG